MEYRKRKLKGGYSKTIKYRVTFKPLLKMLVDLNMSMCEVVSLGLIKYPASFFTGDIDPISLNNLCNYFGVPPNEIFEVEIYDGDKRLL